MAGTELVLGEKFSLTPRNLTEAMDFAKIIAGSDICPKDFQGKTGNVLVAVQMGLEVGLSPLQALQNIAVINGRPTIWGDAVLALVRASGKLESLEERDPSDCVRGGGGLCRVKRRGEAVVERKFTPEDAKAANLLGKAGPWSTSPGRMYQMRARAFALRDVFADVLKGLAVREEVEDYIETTATVSPPTDMTPRAKPAADSKPVEAAPSVDSFVAANPSKAAAASTREREPAPGSKKYGVVSAEKVEKDGKRTFYRVVFWNFEKNAEFKASTFSESLFALAQECASGEAIVEFKQNGEFTNIVAMKACVAEKPAAANPLPTAEAASDDVPFN